MSESETRSKREEPQDAGEAELQASETGKEATRMSCDFCGETVDSVRRVALDGEYDRLRPPHRVRFACPSCSERKERERATNESEAG
jgi:hypothetical protein